MRTKTIVVLGAGPGLGLSVARRFGREGYTAVLVSRSASRHADYVASLAGDGVEAAAYTADVRDRGELRATLDTVAERFGGVDVLYYGPGAVDAGTSAGPITETRSDTARDSMSWVYPAVDAVEHVLPGMVERGDGGLLFATGLSAVRPMPALGSLALAAAALHNYAITLHAALAGQGVYAGSLVIGGGIRGGDIFEAVRSAPERFGDVEAMALDPDEIADAAWTLFSKREDAQVTFDAIG